MQIGITSKSATVSRVKTIMVCKLFYCWGWQSIGSSL